jgi:hypothetical protein
MFWPGDFCSIILFQRGGLDATAAEIFGMPKDTTLFRFHWPDGVTSEGRGIDVADALEKLGLGPVAERSLDYYEVLEETPADKARHDMLKDAYR